MENVLGVQMERMCDETMLLCVGVYERYRGEMKKPGADHWTADTRRYRKAMIEDVFIEWSTVVGDDKYFPWHDDAVCQLWVAWRRLKTPAKVKFCTETGIATTLADIEGDDAEVSEIMSS